MKLILRRFNQIVKLKLLISDLHFPTESGNPVISFYLVLCSYISLASYWAILQNIWLRSWHRQSRRRTSRRGRAFKAFTRCQWLLWEMSGRETMSHVLEEERIYASIPYYPNNAVHMFTNNKQIIIVFVFLYFHFTIFECIKCSEEGDCVIAF